ncbi:MAG: MBL fold metallo-hydrolase [Desulfatibacillaceae bacterium]
MTGFLARYVKNPELEVVKPGWPGNRLVGGRFAHQGFDPHLPVPAFLRWQVSANPQRKEKRTDPYRPPVIPNPDVFDLPEGHMAWLGHASFVFRLGGATILTDPCVGSPPFVKRYAPPPCSLADVRNVDILLASHNHWDHLDDKTVRRLPPACRALVPLRMGSFIRRVNRDVTVEEAGWWQRYSVDDGMEIVLCPAVHWSVRFGVDVKQSLWGSYLVRAGGRTVYFGGDTAYGSHFAEIADLFPGIDLAILPVGAYKPDYLMSGHHMSPREAVRAAADLRAGVLVPMHYGTFDLSDEPVGEPVRVLRGLEEARSIGRELRMPAIGEIVEI